MTNSCHVLIISTKVDVATDDVVRRLSARGVPHYRLNTEDYPFTKTMAYYPGRGEKTSWLICNGQAVPIPSSIWYRRVRTPSIPDGMDEGIANFCRQEMRAVVVGSIVGRRARWMSHPTAVWQAEYKPFQLDLASRLGLKIPRTVITNDPGAIRAAFREFGSMIAKPCRTGYVVCDGIEHSIFTSQVLEDHLEDLASARLSPGIYQELVSKRYDVRVTIVGNRCFAAAIDSQSDPAATVDWRRTENPKLPHYRIAVPGQLEETLLHLMKSLHLEFGAIDLIQTPSGEFVFLEVNPSGQWLWIDDTLQLGISESITDWLAERQVG
jgi:glutathione synthase/RimK-type ligase-like ATP-grasp enzyme